MGMRGAETQAKRTQATRYTVTTSAPTTTTASTSPTRSTCCTARPWMQHHHRVTAISPQSLRPRTTTHTGNRHTRAGGNGLMDGARGLTSRSSAKSLLKKVVKPSRLPPTEFLIHSMISGSSTRIGQAVCPASLIASAQPCFEPAGIFGYRPVCFSLSTEQAVGRSHTSSEA